MTRWETRGTFVDVLFRKLSPPDRRDAEGLDHARAYLETALVLTAASTVACTVAWVGGNVPLAGVSAAAASMGPLGLAVYRLSGRQDLARLLLSGTTLIGFVIAMFVTGGLASPMLPWAPAVPIVLLSLHGYRGAWIAIFSVLFAVLVIALVERAGGLGSAIPSTLPRRLERGLHAILAAMTLLIAYFARERSHRALAERQRVDAHARLEAEAESRAKTNALASVSHEIRTPLTGILGIAELMASTSLDTRQTEWIQTIRSTGDALLAILDDLLDAARLDAGAMPLADKAFHPARVVDQTLALFGPTATARQVLLTASLHADVPERMRGDPARIRQILVNLVGNAIKCTPRGSVEVRVWCEDGATVFAVADTGVGIPPERLDDVFKPFVQLDPSRDAPRGSGLGLSIVRLLAERMRGRVSVKSKVGEGTVFEVRLPLAEATLDDPTDTEVTLAPPRMRLRVLIAEDNPVNQMVLRTLIESMGHTVSIADDGLAALDQLGSFPADVVLMDVQMPRLDGLETTRRLRRDARYKRLPVVALTAGALPTEQEQCLRAGMNGVVSKPVSREALLRTFDALAIEAE